MPDDMVFMKTFRFENLMYTARLNGIPVQEVKQKALQLLDRVGLKKWRQKPESIRGGQRLGHDAN